jgi:hypothetical protein
MKKMIQFYEGCSPILQTLLAAFPTAVVFYFAALLSTWIGELWKAPDAWLKVGIHGVIFVFLATVFLFIADQFKATRAKIHLQIEQEIKALAVQKERERDALAAAHAHCDRVISSIIGRIAPHGSPAEFIELYCGSVHVISEFVKAAYLTFSDSYGDGSDPMTRINFEVTFMTMSYRDKRITIPACANRDSRQPRSMVLRATDPDIYKNTETAKIYRAPRPEPVIVNDTKQFPNYDQLYPGELERLRSSIIYPILSDKNELLGTLVTHCDREGFFDSTRSKYWFDLLEIFAKHIAVEKRKLDVLTSVSANLNLPLPVSPPF